MHDDFRVGVRGKHVATSLELRSMFDVVIDFSIEDDLDRAARVGHGLVSRSEIDDAETAVRKTDPAFDEDACIVRPAVLQYVSHADEDCLAHIKPASGRVRDAANAAHACSPQFRSVKLPPPESRRP